MALYKCSLPVVSTLIYNSGLLDGVEDRFTRSIDSLIIAFCGVTLVSHAAEALAYQIHRLRVSRKHQHKLLARAFSDKHKAKSPSLVPQLDELADQKVTGSTVQAEPLEKDDKETTDAQRPEEEDSIDELTEFAIFRGRRGRPAPIKSLSTPVRRHNRSRSTSSSWEDDLPALSPSLSMCSSASAHSTGHVDMDLVRLRRSSRVEEMIRQFDNQQPRHPNHRRYSVDNSEAHASAMTSSSRKAYIRNRTFGFKPIIGVWEQRIAEAKPEAKLEHPLGKSDNESYYTVTTITSPSPL
ncbi:hypothetical protein BCR43DRAFT_522345 [Syncephalastrum racemosum]|uniref:Uncharacterized protein n=1 Tax=Syncephalastrum racemosum TaxID=13706 RepID=A0A1X2HQE3_SYNRA|nr:hypothetical protein BCR43DRAFT_522345 [Syncephalastrum racemosum]